MVLWAEGKLNEPREASELFGFHGFAWELGTWKCAVCENSFSSSLMIQAPSRMYLYFSKSSNIQTDPS